MDVAELALEVDSRDVDPATAKLNRFGAAANRADGATQKFVRTGRMIRGVMGALGLGIGVRGLMQLSDAYTGMNNLLVVVSDNNREAAQSFRDLTDMAIRTRTPVEALVKVYQRGGMAAADLGASQEDLLKFTENVGKALATSGQSAASASGALLQLSQALGGGVVRAEEFNSILEGAYPIAQAAARGIEGAAGSVSKLRNMVIEGEVTSKQFFDALLSQSAAIDQAFQKTDATIGQAFTNLRTSAIALVGSFNDITGTSSGVANGILYVAENLERIAYAAGVAAVAIGTRYVGAMALAYASTATLTGALGLLRAALLRTGFLAAVVAAGYLIERFVQLTQNTGSLGSALGMLKDVAVEAFERMGLAVNSAGYAMKAVAGTVQEAFLGMFGTVMSGMTKLARGAEAIINNLPGVEGIDISSGMARATNELQILQGSAQMAAKANAEWAAYTLEQAAAPLQAVKALKTALDETATATGGVADGANLAAEAIAAVGGGSGSGSGGSGGGALEKAANDADTLRDSLWAAEDEARRVAAANRRLGDAMAGLFAAGVKGADNLSDAVSNLLGRLGEMAVSNAFQQILGATGAGNIFGTIASGIFGVPAYANGTANHPGGLARINEKGGELVGLPSGSTVVPHDLSKDMMRGGGNSTVNINVNVSGARGNQEVMEMVNQGVAQGIQGIRQVMADRVVQTTQDPRFRGAR